MGAITDYITSPRITPSYLQGHRAQRFLKTFVDQGDDMRSRWTAVAQEARIDSCSGGALNFHATNSRLRRAHNEGDDSFRSYLKTRWDIARAIGTKLLLQKQLLRILPGPRWPEVWSYSDLVLAGITSPFGDVYKHFYFVTIRYPNSWLLGSRWNGGPRWSDGTRWGGIVEPYDGAIDDVVFTIRRFGPSGMCCRFIMIEYDLPVGGPFGHYIAIPLWESWERLPDGSFPPLYNYSWENP